MLYVDEDDISNIKAALSAPPEQAAARQQAILAGFLERIEGRATAWCYAEAQEAAKEGWEVALTDDFKLEIRRKDADRFERDQDAVCYVVWKAATGSKLHRRALGATLSMGQQEARRYADAIRQAEAGVKGSGRVQVLRKAAFTAADRLAVLIECDNEHGAAGDDDVNAYKELLAALRAFGLPNE